MKRAMAILCAGALTALAACKSTDLGSGANTIDREYAKPASDSWNAAVRAAEGMNLNVTESNHDKLGGEIVAKRGTGDDVHIRVKSLDDQHSRVSVRVGSGDRELANMMQEKISEQLGMGKAKGGLFGGASLNGTYRVSLEQAMAAARRSVESLGATVTTQDRTNVEGRMKDSVPVAVRADRVDEGKVRMTFAAGTDKNGASKDLAQRLKDEFEAKADTRPTTD